MEKDKDADKATMSGRRSGFTLQKSRSVYCYSYTRYVVSNFGF